ncbi:MAG: RnfABCDGE type electron transport complex subunit D [Planctomycetota bacterium]|jgi:Na+-transporting NADH:ubiquinone oxidoreductase subunit B
MGENGARAEEPGEGAGRSFPLWDFYLYQKPMLRVVVATVPAILASVYFFGWRSLSVILLSVVVGSFCEWLFCRKRGEPVSSAVLVTAVLFALIMPPRVPYLVVTVGMVVGIVFGKEVFGGFGRNVFNPALVGRCFVYICFPVAMTSEWLAPYGGAGGFVHWVKGADALTRATPLTQHKAGEAVASLWHLLLGNVGGSLGETSALLIALAGVYLVATRTANWRIIVSCLIGAAVASALFHYTGSETVPGPLFTVLSGGLAFGAVFMATDPISAAQTNEGRWLYGLAIGAVTVVIRGYSNFSGGVMFAILLMNMFNPAVDHYIREIKKARKADSGEEEGGEG